MAEEARYKPGDIVKLVLTGEKVMVLQGSGPYQVRLQNLRDLRCLGFELAPVLGRAYIE